MKKVYELYCQSSLVQSLFLICKKSSLIQSVYIVKLVELTRQICSLCEMEMVMTILNCLGFPHV